MSREYFYDSLIQISEIELLILYIFPEQYICRLKKVWPNATFHYCISRNLFDVKFKCNYLVATHLVPTNLALTFCHS